MNNDIQDAIRQADLLMKEGKYKSAWNLLTPYKADPAVRKRLAWLEQKRQPTSQTEQKTNSAPTSKQRLRLYILIAVVIILGVSSLIIYNLSQRKSIPTTEVAEATRNIAASTPSTAVTVPATSTVMPSATPIPPTEDSKEVSLQQRLRDWLASVEGVSQVLSFDVDIPGDEPPLGYVEVVVNSGYNDTKIPDQIAEKLKTELKTTEFSDLAVIMSDGSTTTEYDYDSKSSSWNQTELSSTPKPAD